MEKKPLNLTEAVWIIVVAVIVLGGIVYYSYVRLNESGSLNNQQQGVTPLTAEQRQAILNNFTAPSKSATTTQSGTKKAPTAEQQKVLNSYSASQPKQSASNQQATTNQAVLDSFSAH